MFDRIFVGVDAEGAGDRAVVAAARLQQRFSGEMKFVHAIPLFWRSWSTPAMAAWEAVKKKSIASCKAAFEQRVTATLRAADVPVHETPAVEVIEGSPAESLLKRADRTTDLIALGGHRQLGLLHLGSTARAVLAHSKCPVWIQPDEVRDLQRVTVCVDLSTRGKQVMAAAERMATALRLPLRLLHAFETPTLASGIEPYYAVEHLRREAHAAFETFVEETRRETSAKVTAELCDGEPSTAILDRIEGGDLVVLGTHGHTGLMRYVLGSTAYRVVKRNRQPTLVVPMPENAFR